MPENNGDTISLAEHRKALRELHVERSMAFSWAGDTQASDKMRAHYEGKEHYIVGGEGRLRAWLYTQGFDINEQQL